MIVNPDYWTTWGLIAARICIAMVFLVSGVHKAIWYRKAVEEFREAGAPVIGFTLPATIGLHIGGSLCLIAGVFLPEVALVLIVFTAVATVKVHCFWRFEGQERLVRSRIALGNLALIGGLLLLALIGAGRLS